MAMSRMHPVYGSKLNLKHLHEQSIPENEEVDEDGDGDKFIFATRNRSSDEALLKFRPARLNQVPKPTIREFQQVFRDIDAEQVGYITSKLGKQHNTRHRSPSQPVPSAASQLLSAFAVNQIPLTHDELTSLTKYIATLPRRRHDDVDIPAGALSGNDFVTCLYALSIKNREVGSANQYAVFPDSDFTTETVSQWFKFKRWMWRALEIPHSSRFSMILAWILTTVILLSIVSFLVESQQDIKDSAPDVFFGIELFCVIVFTMEYIARAISTPEPKALFTSVFHWVDLLSIAPFYIELMFDDIAGSAAPLLRSLRLIRIFRLLKIGRYVAWMRIFGRTLELSLPPLGMLAFITLTALLLWSTLGFFIERGTWDEGTSQWVGPTGSPTMFQSIPGSMWWAVVSMSTVGYGDAITATLLGRLVACVAILLGIMLLAIPISIVTSHLHTEYDRMDKLRALRREHEAQAAPAPLASAPPAAGESASAADAVISVPHLRSSTTLHSDNSAEEAKQTRLRPLRAFTDMQLGRSHPSVDDIAAGQMVEASENVIAAPRTLSTISMPKSSSFLQPQERSSNQMRLDAAWSEPFLRSALQVIRGNRRRIMSSLKALELKNRQHAVQDIEDFVSDMSNPDRAKVVLRSAVESAFMA